MTLTATTCVTSKPTILRPGVRGRPGRVLGGAFVLGVLALAAGCETTEIGGDASMMVQPTFTSLYGDYFMRCQGCHTPTALGRTSETEDTLNFTSRATALSTIKTGMASGLVGNQADCNGVPFITAGNPGKSLIVAVIDQPTRQAIDLSPQAANCDESAISDMTLKTGVPPSAAFLTALKTWITEGAMDN